MDLASLEQQEKELVRASFGHEDAWRLGCALRDRAAAQGHPVVIDIRTPLGSTLFHVALPGATADQEQWVLRKSAVVFRFEASSAAVAERMASGGIDPTARGWLDPAVYAVTGGSFPIRVTGAGIVAAVTVSGLASLEDHNLAVEALRDLPA